MAKTDVTRIWKNGKRYVTSVTIQYEKKDVDKMRRFSEYAYLSDIEIYKTYFLKRYKAYIRSRLKNKGVPFHCKYIGD